MKGGTWKGGEKEKEGKKRERDNNLPAGWHIDKKSGESVVLVGGEKGRLGVMLPYQGNNQDLHNPGDTILDNLSATLL